MVHPGPRIHVGPVPLDCVSFQQALDEIAEMIASGSGGTVFTPNVDHVVLAAQDRDFRHAYDGVDLSLADGMPVVWASHLYAHHAPEKVSGSDLVPTLLARAARAGWRVFLLGGGDGVAERAADRAGHAYPGLRIVGVASPRIDMHEPAGRRAELIERIGKTRPNLVLVALGAPKQELWIEEAAPVLRPAVLVGIGASLDFLAGAVRRAPVWMSSAGLEWLYRLAHEPRRLWRRYLVRDPRFLLLLLHERMHLPRVGAGAT